MRFEWPTSRPKSEWAHASEEERGLWASNLLIDHRDVRVIVEDVSMNLAHVHRTQTSAAMLVLGESGSGKTTLQDQLVAQINSFYGRDDPERTIVPALCYKVPSPCTPREFCFALLEALGDHNPRGRKGGESLLEDTAALMNACEVRLSILDNTQDIPNKRGVRGVEQVSVCIRELIDRTQFLWMFLGTARATEVVDNESQLIKRIPYRTPLSYFTIGELPDAIRFKKLLARLDEWLPLVELNRKIFNDLSGLIFIACGGVLDRLVKLLDRVWFCAFESSREYLVKEDFVVGFRRVHGRAVDNPFSEGFKIRLLNGKNEPFEHLREGKPKSGSRIVRARRGADGDVQ